MLNVVFTILVTVTVLFGLYWLFNFILALLGIRMDIKIKFYKV